MNYVLTFSHINTEGQRVTSYDERGQEVTLSVEAESKTAAMMSEATREFAIARGMETCVRGVR